MMVNGSSTMINLIPLSQFNMSAINVSSFAAAQLPDAVVSFFIKFIKILLFVY